MRKAFLLLLIPFALLHGGCGPSKMLPAAKTVHPVTILVFPESVTVRDRPAFIGSGDSLLVRVFDRAFANRYLVRDSQAILTPLEVSAMTGDTSLKVMSLAFPPSQILTPGAPDVRPLDVEALSTLPGAAPRARGNRAAQAYDSVLVLIVAENAVLKALVDTMTAKLDTLRARVRSDRAEYARLKLMHDTSWFAPARAFATDPGIVKAGQLLERAGSSRTDSVLSPAELYEARKDLELYGRRLDIFRALLPADPPAALADTSRVPTLMQTVARLSAAYTDVLARRAEREREAKRLAARLRNRDPIPPAPERAGMIVVGMDLTQLLASPQSLQAVADESRIRLDAVNVGTVKVVTAANQLPRWTVASDTTRIFTQLYPSEKEVRIVVTRRSRFAPWGTAAPAGAAAPAKPASTTTTSGGTTVTTTTTVTQGGTETAAASSGAAAAAAPAATMPLVVVPRTDDTVAVLSIPVLQRYRFRLGVGMLFSTLRNPVVETHPGVVNGDSGVYVNRVGHNEHRFVPVALLSSTIYPWEGRYVDGRARRYPWQNLSVSLQTGVSLQNPTEHLYAGLAIEPLQGFEIGAGVHAGYVPTTRRQSGEFVRPSDGPVSANRWKDAWALSTTLDATTFVRAFGSLLGL